MENVRPSVLESPRLEEACSPAVCSPSVNTPDPEETFCEFAEMQINRPDSPDPRLSKFDQQSLIKSDSIFGDKEINSLLENVPEINGSDLENLIKFIVEVDLIVCTPLVPELTLLKGLTFKFRGSLRDWWFSQLTHSLTWFQAKNELLNRYLTPIDRARLGEKFLNREQGPNEDYLDFVEDVVKYVPLFGSSLTEVEIVTRLWLKQNSSTFEYMQYRDPPETLMALKRLASRFRVISRQRALLAPTPKPRIMSESIQTGCYYCKQPGHRIAECPVRPVRDNSGPRVILPRPK